MGTVTVMQEATGTEEQLLTVQDVQKELREQGQGDVGRSTVYRWIESGELPAMYGGLRWPGKRVKPADLADFIRRRTEGENVA
jgi:hypothetical protein